MWPLTRKCTLRLSVWTLKTIRLLFAIHLSSVHDRWDAVWTDWILRSEKKNLVARTAAAIHSKKIFIRSNGWGCPFEKKSSSVWMAEVIHSIKIITRSNSWSSIRIKSSSVWKTKKLECRCKLWIFPVFFPCLFFFCQEVIEQHTLSWVWIANQNAWKALIHCFGIQVYCLSSAGGIEKDY